MPERIAPLGDASEQEMWDSWLALICIGAVTVTALCVALAMLYRGRQRLLRTNEELKQQVRRSERLLAERAAPPGSVPQPERLDGIELLACRFAHDFNNILVAITGNAQLLLAEGELDDGQRQSLHQIVAASARAASLCKDIVARANQTARETSVVDLREVLEHVVPLARAGCSAGVSVEANLGDEPLQVRGDQSQLEQVFLNLLVNAGDAVAGQGSVTVQTGVRKLGGRPSNGYWFGEFTQQPRECAAVSVVDDGHGMSVQTVQQVFGPLLSAPAPAPLPDPSPDPLPVRGIGLAASFDILRRHQGVVEIESQVDKGTRFTVYLPLAPRSKSTATVR